MVGILWAKCSLALCESVQRDARIPSPSPTSRDKHSEQGKKDQEDNLTLYTVGDNITGEVKVTPMPGKRLDHQGKASCVFVRVREGRGNTSGATPLLYPRWLCTGIRVQLVGRVQIPGERNDFLTLTREIAPPGEFR